MSSNPRIRSNLISLHGPREEAAKDQLIRGNERHVCMYVKQVAFYAILLVQAEIQYHGVGEGGGGRDFAEPR